MRDWDAKTLTTLISHDACLRETLNLLTDADNSTKGGGGFVGDFFVCFVVVVVLVVVGT